MASKLGVRENACAPLDCPLEARMPIRGLHLLLTYLCNYECDHCFVWGSPRQRGVMTLAMIQRILDQADELDEIEWIYFEGGEPFLYYPVLLAGAKKAAARGYRVGLVTNAYWATSKEDARIWLEPFAGMVEDLSVSSDLYHGESGLSDEANAALNAAEVMGIPADVIAIAQPEDMNARPARGMLPPGESALMYRGRAAEVLGPHATTHDWASFDTCPYEDLAAPGRVHLDPFGYVHLCQGIALGNILEDPLTAIFAGYEPSAHPIAGPLIEGGPAELVRRYGLEHTQAYADACHLCDHARRQLRARFPRILAPDAMYGIDKG